MGEIVHDGAQPMAELFVCGGMDAPVGTAAAFAAPLLNHAPSGIRQTGIDTQDDHAASLSAQRAP